MLVERTVMFHSQGYGLFVPYQHFDLVFKRQNSIIHLHNVEEDASLSAAL